MKKIILGLFLLSLTACGGGIGGGMSSASPAFVDASLQSFVDKFEEEAAARGGVLNVKKLSVKFDIGLEKYSIRQGGYTKVILGQCKMFLQDTSERLVIINPVEWAKMTIVKKELLMFHELAHCLMDTEHRGDWIKSPEENAPRTYVPSSIMLAQAFSGELYLMNYNYLLDELFKGQENVDYANYVEVINEFDIAYYEENVNPYPEYATEDSPTIISASTEVIEDDKEYKIVPCDYGSEHNH